MAITDYDLKLAKIVLESATGKHRVFTDNQLTFIREQGLARQRVYELVFRHGSAGLGIIEALEEKVMKDALL